MKRLIPLLGLITTFVLLGLFISSSSPQASTPKLNEVKTLEQAPKNTLVTEAELEKFLADNKASEDIAAAYRFARENPQNVLSQVKCYCGCMKSKGHQSNRECFIKPDGSLDLMGLNCGLCVKTALTSKQMLSEGKSVKEISDYIDSKFAR